MGDNCEIWRETAEIREAAHAANETMVQCEVVYFTTRYNIYCPLGRLPRGLAADGCEGRSNSSHGILRTLRNLSSLSPSPPRPPARPPALRDGGTLTSPGMAAHSRPQGWRYTHVLRDGSTLASSGKELYTTACSRLLLDGVVLHVAAAGWGCTPLGL